MTPMPFRFAELLGWAIKPGPRLYGIVFAFVLCEALLIVAIILAADALSAFDAITFAAVGAVLTIALALPVNLQSCAAYLSLLDAKNRIEQLSRTDVLTGLPNRRVFLELVDQHAGEPLTLAILDIDRFKAVNDTKGHVVGDRVLVAVATELARDLTTVGTLCRIGGEEFALLCFGRVVDDVLPSIERACAAVEALQIRSPSGAVRVTLSCGLAATPSLTEVHPLYAAADSALYAAKAAGRNQVMLAAA